MPGYAGYESQMSSNRSSVSKSMPQGHTYLLQMIAHDILRATDPACGGERAEFTMNLDSVYGAAGSAASAKYFDLASGLFSGIQPDRDWDLPRDADGVALIPESRNDENIIIAQLHSLWMRLHNYVLTQHVDVGRIGVPAAILETRRIVTALFQMSIVFDVLPQLLYPPVYRAYFGEHTERLIDVPHAVLNRYFAKAVFRFGHSMVRTSYRLKSNKVTERPVTLSRILRHTDAAGTPGYNLSRTIESDLRVNWRAFFPVFSADANLAFAIDTHVAGSMASIPACHPLVMANTGQPLPPTKIVTANLTAADNDRLPSGGEVRQQLVEGLVGGWTEQALELDVDVPLGGAFDSTESARNAPLWIYVLSEAEQKYFNATSPDQLGPLASLVVADVIHQSISTVTAREGGICAHGGYSLDAVMEQAGTFGYWLKREHERDRNRPPLGFLSLLKYIPDLLAQ